MSVKQPRRIFEDALDKTPKMESTLVGVNDNARGLAQEKRVILPRKVALKTEPIVVELNMDAREHSNVKTQKPRLKAERGRPVWQIAIGSLVLAGLLIAGPLLILRPQTQKYRLATWNAATVGSSEFIDTTSGTGTLIPLRVLDLKSIVEGRVSQVLVLEGRAVIQGQVLLSVGNQETEEAQTVAAKDLENAQKAVERARPLEKNAIQQGILTRESAIAKLEIARRELKTLQEIFDAGGESRRNVELAQEKVSAATRDVTQSDLNTKKSLLEAQKSLSEAQAQLEHAQNNLVTAKRKVGQGKIVAPFGGRVTELKVLPGQTLSRGDTLLTLVDPAIRNAQVVVDASKADKLQVGQPVRIEVGGRSLTGTVNLIGVQAEQDKNQSNNTIRLDVRLDQMVTGFRPNTQVTAEIETARRKNIRSIERGSFLASGGGQFVFVLSSDGTKALRRSVQLGDSSGNRVEVISGLEIGEKVLTSSYDAFREFPEVDLATTGELK
jgi:HlyD family secretion protein